MNDLSIIITTLALGVYALWYVLSRSKLVFENCFHTRCNHIHDARVKYIRKTFQYYHE